MKKKVIEIVVFKGLVDSVKGIPKDYQVKIIDYDVEGVPEEDLIIVDGIPAAYYFLP